MSQNTVPAYLNELAKYFKTEKQRQFSTNFFTDAEHYEVWDEIDFSNLEEVDGENTFTIKAEDLKFYAEGCLDGNPYMTDEEFAKKSPYGELVAHPLFVTALAFWCVGIKGRGNWIRTPGARNPGQYHEYYENFKVGETIHIKLRPYDRYEKRGKYYLQYKRDFYNQDNVLKASSISTLILPRTKDDIRKFLKGIRGLSD
ncbi:MAG: MaoC family dehydratase [bacterium]